MFVEVVRAPVDRLPLDFEGILRGDFVDYIDGNWGYFDSNAVAGDGDNFVRSQN